MERNKKEDISDLGGKGWNGGEDGKRRSSGCMNMLKIPCMNSQRINKKYFKVFRNSSVSASLVLKLKVGTTSARLNS